MASATNLSPSSSSSSSSSSLAPSPSQHSHHRQNRKRPCVNPSPAVNANRCVKPKVVLASEDAVAQLLPALRASFRIDGICGKIGDMLGSDKWSLNVCCRFLRTAVSTSDGSFITQHDEDDENVSTHPNVVTRLPFHVHTVIFRTNLDLPIPDALLPSSLRTLVLGHGMNQPLNLAALPTLTTLIFGDSYNQPLPPHDDILPSSITTLAFGTAFNQPRSALASVHTARSRVFVLVQPTHCSWRLAIHAHHADV